MRPGDVMRRAEDWIKALELKRHPEGGFYREVYRSPERIPRAALPDRFDGDRSFATSIYFLLESDDVSALHRLRQDEVWHFYAGAPLSIHVIGEDRSLRTLTLGQDPSRGENLQSVVRAGSLFGAVVDRPESYALVGCTVAPGFEFDDFEMPDRRTLTDTYPEHRALIERLTR